MSKIEKHDPGSFCWAELGTSDAGSAKKFYSEMFNWTVIEHPMPEGVYTIFQSEGNDAAAMYAAPAGVPPNWQSYFTVVNVNESSALVEILGGKVIAGPYDVMDAGRMAVAQDPQGAGFALWQAKNSIGMTHGGPLNQPCWPELATSDPVTAVKFYSDLFGWTTVPGEGFESAQYVEWVNGKTHFGGLLPMRGPKWNGVPPHWTIYISVANCDERVAKAKDLGANVCVPPTDIPNTGRFSVISDPQGAVFSLFERKAI